MIVRRLALTRVVVCGALVWVACHDCNFKLLWRTSVSDGTQDDEGKLGCCGASFGVDVTIPQAEGSEIDLANTKLPGESGRVDAWLTEPGCDQLFDGTYPGASPRCRTYIGPVAPDQVSARMKITTGSYRIVVQAYTSNTTPSKYSAEVGLWGYDCKFKANQAAP